MTNVAEIAPDEIMGNFIKQFYAGTPYLPKTIMLQTEIEDASLIEQWLSSRKGSRVYLEVRRSERKKS